MKKSLSAADTTRTPSLSIAIPLLPYRLPSPISSPSNPCGMACHHPGAGWRRLCRPCLGMRHHGNLPPASLSIAIATPIIAGRSIPNPRSGRPLPYVGRPALGWPLAASLVPLGGDSHPSGAVRAGREPRVGRRALGYPPPRARGFCPAVRAPFVQLARSLSMIFALSAILLARIRSLAFRAPCSLSLARALLIHATPTPKEITIGC